MNPTLQTEATECALACAVMILSHHGHHVSLPELRTNFTSSRNGTSLLQLDAILRSFGLQTRSLKLEVSEIPELRLPCIAHWGMDHFVVIEKVRGNTVWILDPAVGRRKVGMAELDREFTGIAMEAIPTVNFKARKKESPIPLSTLTGPIRGRWRSLTLMLILSLAVQVCLMAAPFYMQWVTDHVLLVNDRKLLLVMAIGFGLLTLFNVMMSVARSWTVAYVANRISIQWVSSVFGTLLRLPMDWFGKRHLGDITSRFQSIQAIQRTLTVSFVEAILDGVMTVLTLSMMFWYSPLLGTISLAAVLIYSIVRWILFMPSKVGAEKQMILAAKQQTYLLESIRGIQSVKTTGIEGSRSANYTNHVVATTNADFALAKLGMWMQGASQTVFGLERVAVIAIAALLVLNRELTVGMLFAYLAYKDQFTGRTNNLIDKWLEFRMLKLHATRLSDIVLTPEEHYGTGHDLSWDRPSLEVVNLSFRYSANEPWILKDCTFTVKPGESIAIVGPSGCGKSTLIKLLTGLYTPTAGQVLLAGQNVHLAGAASVRHGLGVVMQDDQLFAGSIAENIALGEARLDMDRIVEAAKRASIHADIDAMPMKYHTLIGDMGSTLSGGQKQRVVLARALYRKPALLVLDEATSHLDAANEKSVNDAIANLNITRIIVAHRKETIESADRVLVMHGGRIVHQYSPKEVAAQQARALAQTEASLRNAPLANPDLMAPFSDGGSNDIERAANETGTAQPLSVAGGI